MTTDVLPPVLVARLRRHSAGDTVRLTVGDGTTQPTVPVALDGLGD